MMNVEKRNVKERRKMSKIRKSEEIENKNRKIK